MAGHCSRSLRTAWQAVRLQVVPVALAASLRTHFALDGKPADNSMVVNNQSAPVQHVGAHEGLACLPTLVCLNALCAETLMASFCSLPAMNHQQLDLHART